VLQVTKDRPAANELVAGDEHQCNNDSDTHNCGAAGHLSVTSLLEDIQSSDLQFHSIHLTNRSPSHQAALYTCLLHTIVCFVVQRFT